ncbi:YjiH family protein [Thauera chlorobenzoica]|uniref:Putative histidine uptake transporter n=1 Tax=Thauera chlorobenzoica TaxID=96773 RepID=A0A1H5RZ59_9RHOO|nr:YjiH family protein [Thauera chlorobenzoica]APR05088.1 putative histidine uptake transporter [Thauera chlorobenzoica]SEF42801.1 nucleoside recognition GATE domain-containing membrane protein YjiH [Thauera chlorobenzoica]
MTEQPTAAVPTPARNLALVRLLGYSLVGLLIFFVPFEIGGKSTIVLDHAASFLLKEARPLVIGIAMLLMAYGALQPWIHGTWRENAVALAFSVLKVLGLAIGVAFLFRVGPEAVYAPGMLPFLFDKLVLTLALIVPLGALALVFLIGFGLLELTGVLTQPVMRPIWRTPGKSAIDAVASFVGSYSVGLLITARMYAQGHYTLREAAIIATGFSTVSAPFMVIVAKTLDLMPAWNLYFWGCMAITFAVTAVSARIYPISRLPSEGSADPALPTGRSRVQAAWDAGLEHARSAPPLWASLRETFTDGLRMTAAILPSILAVGLLGLLAAKYTPVFDILGVLLYPVTWAFGLDEPMAVARAVASGLAEMFLPAMLMKEADVVVRFTVAVVSVSSVLFLSASIPCVIATRIPLRMRDLLLVWLQRTFLSLVFTIPFAQFAHKLGWL